MNKDFTGVYGFPRVGLCLAVALSHSLQIPLLTKPESNSLIIDDIYETGTTLNSIRDLPGISAFVWISKVHPVWWNSIEIIESNEWIVFPWENIDYAFSDQIEYKLSRGMNT